MNLRYVFKEALAGFQRARLASFTSIFSIFIAILLLGILARVSFNVYRVAESLKSSIDVEVFLKNLDTQETGDLKQKLGAEDLIKEVNYISKDSAATIFKHQFGADVSSLAKLDFLPASFRLKMVSGVKVSRVDSLAGKIRSFDGVEKVKFNQKLLQVLQRRFKTVITVGSAIGLLILLASVILVFNTIRLTIYAKRGLIKAMKLVGATNAFIRRPFVIEGLLQGLFGALLAVIILYVGFQYAMPVYFPDFGVLSWPFGHWYYLCGAMFLLAMLMGFGGSQWAARRFIKKTSISE